jgi:hypothetical protein
MWGRKRKSDAPAKDAEPSPLQEALHQARVEAAERTSVVVDLRDAEVARLELLNEALDPLFAEIPPEVDLFDRGVSRGETPRLWIDAVAHVAESHEIADIVPAVTTYVARRLIERQRALEEDPGLLARVPAAEAARFRRRRRWRIFGILALGFIAGAVALIVLASVLASRG